MGAEPTGVHVVVSTEYQVAVVSVAGEVATTAQAHEVADRLLDVVPADGPVIVDLSRLVVAPDELAWLILRFEAAPHWHRFRLVDDRIDHRRDQRHGRAHRTGVSWAPHPESELTCPTPSALPSSRERSCRFTAWADSNGPYGT